MMNKTLIFSLLVFFGSMSDYNHTEHPLDEESTEVSANASKNNSGELAKNQLESKSEDSGIINFLLKFTRWILGTLLSIFVLTILYFIYTNYRNRIDELKQKIWSLESKFNNLAKITIKKNDLDDYKKAIEIINKKIESFYSEIDNIKNQVSTSSKINTESLGSQKKQYIDVNFDEKQSKQNVTEPLIITKSFTVPNEDGRFENHRAVENSSGNMIYFKITHEDGSSVGKLDYNQGRLDQSAIDKRDSILKPVCNIKNPEIEKPTKIHQITPGEVELSDGFWMVKEKIQIEFV